MKMPRCFVSMSMPTRCSPVSMSLSRQALTRLSSPLLSQPLQRPSASLSPLRSLASPSPRLPPSPRPRSPLPPLPPLSPLSRQPSLLRLQRSSIRLLLAALLCASVPLNCRASPPLVPISAEPLAAACTASSPAGLRGTGSGAPLLLTQAGSALFQATFDGSGGHFDDYTLAFSGGQASAGPSLWDAGDLLTGGAGRPARPAPESRLIYTLRTDGSNVTLPFLWPDLTDAQRALLDMAPFAAKKKSDGLGAQRVAFLRGDRGLEGAPFRRRVSVLVYVGVASAAVQGDGYQAFYTRSKWRRAAVYLGANDGMLHAFDVVDGG